MTLQLTAADRARRAELKHALRDLERPAKEAQRAQRKATRQARPKSEKRVEHKPTKQGRERDHAYLSWLHEGIPCIGCLILGPAPREHSHREAAQQKAQDAARGWHKLMGRRVHDRQCVTLCAWHHRLAPNCCDPAQARFWSLLGVDVIDLCTDLYAAFTASEPGATVIRRFAAGARSAA